jgi:lysophospholipase L1-like esterase
MPSQRFFLCSVAALLIGLVSGTVPAADPSDRWEPAIRKFEAQDSRAPPPAEANVFVGSSSIVFWKLADSFPGYACVNRGFGGSQLADSARYADRIVTPYRPRVVVLYAGDNDLAAGKAPEAVRDDYTQFAAKVRAKLPEAKIVFVSIKPSVLRWGLAEKMRTANTLIAGAMKDDPKQVFVDVWPAMLGPDGKPRRELFVFDGLHLSAEGYKVWAGLVKPHLVAPPAGERPRLPPAD